MNNPEQAAGSTGSMRESLSALMDDESHELELQRILKHADADDRAAWSRYQLVSSLLKNQQVQPVAGVALADRVSAALDEGQPAVSLTARGRFSALGRLAVAASVALAVIAGVQWQQREGQRVAGAATARLAVAAPVVPAPALVAPAAQPAGVLLPQPAPVMASQQLPAAQSAQLERYMKYHLERGAVDNSRGMMPLARTTVYDDKR